MLPRCHCRSSSAKVGWVPTPELARFNRPGPKNSEEAVTLSPCGQRESDMVRPISSLKTRWIAAPCHGRCWSTSGAKLTTSANGYGSRRTAGADSAPTAPLPDDRASNKTDDANIFKVADDGHSYVISLAQKEFLLTVARAVEPATGGRAVNSGRHIEM